MLFQTEEAHSNLDQTTVKYNNNKLSIVEKESQCRYKSQHFEWLGTYLMNMMAKKKEFRIQKNSYVSDGVGTNYAFITKFVITINWTGFSCKGDDLSFSILSFIQLAVQQPWMEPMSDRSVLSVAQLKGTKILISSEIENI
jgi:hypothetical protein